MLAVVHHQLFADGPRHGHQRKVPSDDSPETIHVTDDTDGPFMYRLVEVHTSDTGDRVALYEPG